MSAQSEIASAGKSASVAANPARGSLLGQILVATSILGSAIVPPGVWINAEHANNPAWQPHARFHVVWAACLVWALGGIALAALVARWNRDPMVRAALMVFPLVIAFTFFFAGLVMAPLMNIAEPFRESTPMIVLGIDIKLTGWIALGAVDVVGYLLDRRARKAAG